MALRVFTSCRAALEVTRGTDLTPTRLIYGEEFTHEQTFRTVRPEELRNSYEGWFDAQPGVETNTFGISGRTSYTDAIWYGNLFVGPLASGTGAGADKTWDFTAVMSNTADNVKTATVELGFADTIATAPGVELNNVLGSTWNLHYEKNDDGALLFAATFMNAGAADEITAFTGALSDRTTVAASCNNTQVFIDAATIGTTADNNVESVDWTLDLQPVPFFALNNSSAASAVYRPNHRTWTATIVRQYASNSELSVYKTKAERKIRIRTLGGVLGGSNYKIDLDLYGTYTNRVSSETNGIITETLTFEPLAKSLTKSFGFIVVNDITAIT